MLQRPSPQSGTSTLLFARYPLPAPPAHSASYLHSFPYSRSASVYSDSVSSASSSPCPSTSLDSYQSPYDAGVSSRSLADDGELLQAQEVQAQVQQLHLILQHMRRYDPAAVGPQAHRSSPPPLSLPPPLLSPPSPSPPSSPAAHRTHSRQLPPLPPPTPPPAPLPAHLLSSLLSSTRRLSARELGLQAECETTRPQCAICMEALTVGSSILTLHCLHVFHSACCVTWLKRSAHCPLCRRTVGDDRQSAEKARADEQDRRWREEEQAGDELRGWRYA